MKQATRNERRLTLPSGDWPVGIPYNIAQYALLLAKVAQVSNMVADELLIMVADAHVYTDQLPLIDEQLSREPLPLPKLWLNPEVTDLFKFKPEDVRIEGYEFHPPISYPVAK
jgi:thymidylate synthase